MFCISPKCPEPVLFPVLNQYIQYCGMQQRVIGPQIKLEDCSFCMLTQNVDTAWSFSEKLTSSLHPSSPIKHALVRRCRKIARSAKTYRTESTATTGICSCRRDGKITPTSFKCCRPYCKSTTATSPLEKSSERFGRFHFIAPNSCALFYRVSEANYSLASNQPVKNTMFRR